MTEPATFVRDADCPAHDQRCTAELCIMQPAHPNHGDFLRWRERRFIATDDAGNVIAEQTSPFEPFRKTRMNGWECTAPGEWERVDDPDDTVSASDGMLCVHTSGTYGEGGTVEIPLLIVRMVLDEYDRRPRAQG